MNKVYLIGSLHWLHQNNKNYGFEDIYEYVRKINPDVIAVEIREEDLSLNRESLDKMYPKEMVDTLTEHKDDKIVEGFDWLGNEVVGKSIPEEYFKESNYAVLGRELMQDEKYSKVLKTLNIVDTKKSEMLKNGDIKKVHHEFYDYAVEMSREQFKDYFEDTKYIDILNFDLDRNENINKNIIKIVQKHEDKTILVITGRDHVGHIKRVLKDNGNLEVVTPYDIKM